MPTFAFQARDRSGQAISGTRDANDQRAALESLREAGFFVLDLKPTRARAAETVAPTVVTSPQSTLDAAPVIAAGAAGTPDRGTPGAGSGGDAGAVRAPQSTLGAAPAAPKPATAAREIDFKARANSKQLSLFFRQMHALLNAGTSVSRALETIAAHDPNKHLRRVAHSMSQSASRGQSWSESMRAFPGLFSPLMIGMIAAGEQGGFLDRICLKLSENAERDYELQQAVKRETWYPKLLVWLSFLIPSVVPLVTQGFGAWLHAVIPPTIFLLTILALWRTFTYFRPLFGHLRPLQRLVDTVKLSVPVSAKVVRGFAAAKFSRALASMYAAGMAPHAAIRLAAQACGNTIVEDAALSVIPNVQRGEGMADSLAATRQFPPIALQMLRSGEETGDIDSQLEKVADFLENDAETAMKQAVMLFSILVYLMIAAYIGSQVVSFYLGSFNAAFEAGENAAKG